MTIEQAIKKAIVGGWNSKSGTFLDADKFWATFHNDFGLTNQPTAGILLDSTWWQSLGKAMGWGSFYDEEGMPRNYNTQGWYPITETDSGKDEKMWQAQWHRFIDHLAEGKTAESFFESLT